jgi:hypothetical protein
MSTTHRPRRPDADERSYVRSYEPARRLAPLFRIGNAILRPILRSRLGARMPALALLSFTGRKSGKRYSVPVGFHELDERAAILTASAWKANFRGGADVEIVTAGVREPMRALLVDEPDEVADVYRTLLARVGVEHGSRIGVKVAGHRMPTHEEMVRAIGGRRAVVWLSPR